MQIGKNFLVMHLSRSLKMLILPELRVYSYTKEIIRNTERNDQRFMGTKFLSLQNWLPYK